MVDYFINKGLSQDILEITINNVKKSYVKYWMTNGKEQNKGTGFERIIQNK